MELLGLWTCAFKNFLNIVKLIYKVYYSLDTCFWMCIFFFNFIEVWLICKVLISAYNKVIVIHIYYFFTVFSIMAYYRILNIIPSAIQ